VELRIQEFWNKEKEEILGNEGCNGQSEAATSHWSTPWSE